MPERASTSAGPARDPASGPGARATAPALAPARRPATPMEALALQRTAGNRAMLGQLQRRPGYGSHPGCGCDACQGRLADEAILARATVKVGGERVRARGMAAKAVKAEAERIITKLSTEYGIAVDSVKAIDAVKAGYPHAPERVRNKLRTRRWSLWELQVVEQAADSFKPILGKMRASSTRAATPQEVTRIGKLRRAIDEDTASGALDTDTVGEYFADDDTMVLFKAGERYGGIFGEDYKKKRLMTAHHEMAHGLMKYALPGFVAAMDYWLDEDAPSGLPDAEAPPTEYGKTNAGEDFAESVALYFVDRTRLENGDGTAKGEAGNACPERLAYIKAVVEGWTPPPPTPTPAPSGETAVATPSAAGGA